MEKLHLVQVCFRIAQSREKIYIDKRKRDHEFEVDNHKLFKASCGGMKRFAICAKVSPKFVCGFQIMDEFLEELSIE